MRFLKRYSYLPNCSHSAVTIIPSSYDSTFTYTNSHNRIRTMVPKTVYFRNPTRSNEGAWCFVQENDVINVAACDVPICGGNNRHGTGQILFPGI